MRYGYPVFLDLAGQRCLVLGDGPLADEKKHGLESAGAVVTHQTRPFAAGDLRGYFLAVACSQNHEENARIFAEAERENVLLNCLDDPPHCRFIYPSIHRQGDLVVAISTTGKCPALAVRLREHFGRQLGPEYAKFLDVCGRLRARIARALPDFATRKALWYRLVDSPAICLFHEGRDEEATMLLDTLVGEHEKQDQA